VPRTTRANIKLVPANKNVTLEEQNPFIRDLLSQTKKLGRSSFYRYKICFGLSRRFCPMIKVIGEEGRTQQH
jgi:hypothetical protein